MRSPVKAGNVRRARSALRALSAATEALMACEGGEPAKDNRAAARTWAAVRRALAEARSVLERTA